MCSPLTFENTAIKPFNTNLNNAINQYPSHIYIICTNNMH